MRCPIFRCCRSSSPPPLVKQSVHEAFLCLDMDRAFSVLSVKNERDLNHMDTGMCCCKKWYRTYTEQKRWELVRKYVESQKSINSPWASLNQNSFPLLKALCGSADKSKNIPLDQNAPNYLVKAKFATTKPPIPTPRNKNRVLASENVDNSSGIPQPQGSNSDISEEAPQRNESRSVSPPMPSISVKNAVDLVSDNHRSESHYENENVLVPPLPPAPLLPERIPRAAKR